MKVLCVGAHLDDCEYGCGGTIARLTNEGHEVHVLVLTDSCTAQYKNSKKMITQKKCEAAKIKKFLGIKEYIYLDFPDMKLDTVPHKELNDAISNEIDKLRPEWIFTHSPTDLNKDHRIAFESTMVAARPHKDFIKKIMSYEVPSTTELGSTQFNPNLFIDISRYMDKKLKAVELYKSELRIFPYGRSTIAVRTLALYRGYSSMQGCSEAFVVVREKI